MNLLLSIYHLGLINGYRYWRLNRYYSKHPDELKEFIEICRQRAVLEPHFPWAEFASQCEKSLNNYLRRKKN